MAITTKRRRQIEVGGRRFVWWVAPDDDSNDLLLRVCSSDKHFLIRYALGQPEDRRHLVVLGRDLPPLADAGGVWIRLRTPPWSDDPVTPRLVRQIIEWGLDPSKSILRVDGRGSPLP